jgi:16S rRNA (cytosine967-C5)-methyltransferase
MKSPRETALEVLLRIESGGAYGDRVLSSPRISMYDFRDRSFIRELVNGVMRWKLRLDRTIDRYYVKRADSLSPPIRMILRLGLYQLMCLNSVPARAAVHESVGMASRVQGKGAGGLVNALLRRFTRDGEPQEWPDDPAERLSLELSYPLWLARRWIEHFGRETAEILMRTGNERHPVCIRLNALRTSAAGLIRALSEDGFEASGIGAMPGYLSVREAEGLFGCRSFQSGLFAVQDPSAAMASILLDPEPGGTVLDLCAAPGGKTTHIAELTGDRGHILAVDIHPGRCRLVEETASRLGYTSIMVAEGDACTFGGDSGERFDRVLLDAPCTGTAVYAKRPDMKWRKEESDIPRLAMLQMEMLENAARLTKPGGTLVYSTCSLEPEENSDLVRAFLRERPDFVPKRDERFAEFSIDYGYLILPHRMHGTGAFAAKLERAPHGG